MDKSDQQLVREYLDGDEEALAALVKRYLDSIYRFAYRLTGSASEANDITQEVFIKAWRSIKKFDTNKSFKAWIFTIARNATTDFLRKRKNAVFSELDNETENFTSTLSDPDPLPDEIFQRKELQQTLEQALSTVSVEQKTIILLHLTENLTFEEIAAIENKPMNTVKSTYRRGLHNLKKYFEKLPAAAADAPK